MKMRFMLLLCAAVALTVGIGTASAGGGNSDAAKACQNGGWQNLVRQDGTGFKNQGDCVSYAAQGGVLSAKSVCSGGTENFAGDVQYSQPATFAGGTIDTAYGPSPDGSYPAGGVLYWFAQFGDTHSLYSGLGVNSFRLTFTNAVNSVQLQAASSNTQIDTHVTLTGYDASNHVVDTASALNPSGNVADVPLQIHSATNNIKYFTVATDDPNTYGLGFSNIAWGCA